MERQDKTTTLTDRFLIGQKMFRLAVADIASTYRDAFVPSHIEKGEGLLSYLGRRAEERKEADEVLLKSYILEKQIGSVAARERLESGFTNEFF
ncbi:MAG TPA: hypothetical protein VFH99_02970 [Candidatus Saccharimonadales bacterium]|nr:hypothetical protein [Candidatus Saccharimonadales bacterium]